jgi:Rho-binding antiterminator
MENQPQSNKQYKPISSDFYDELEAAATTGQICEIVYRDENGQETKVISTILDLYTHEHVEYAKLENQIIRLDSIVNVNGKSEGHPQIDLDFLEQDMLPADSTDDQPMGLNQTSATSGDYATSNTVENIGNSSFTEHGDRNMGIAQPAEGLTDTRVIGDLHQNERVQENLLGETIPVGQMASEYPLQLDEESDFAHRFTTSETPFLIAENDFYSLTADRMRNRLYVKALRSWDEQEDVMEIGSYFSRIAPLMNGAFTLLNDLTALEPDEDGNLMAPAFPNKDVLLDAGLVKVADVVPEDCDTLVHGIDSFSVNSVRLRYFKDHLQAEHWLGDDHRETGTPDDLSLN